MKGKVWSTWDEEGKKQEERGGGGVGLSWSKTDYEDFLERERENDGDKREKRRELERV